MTPELRLPPGRDQLGALYPWLDSVAAGVEPGLLARMHVVLEEAVANAALHGFPDGRRGGIVVRFHRAADHLRLEIEDDGIPFDPSIAAPRPRPASLETIEPGGWGLGLIRRYASRIDYRRQDGRNLLTLTFVPDP